MPTRLGSPHGLRQALSFLARPKRIKAKYLMAEATLQRGCRSIPLKLLRELAGSAQYWSVVCPELKPYLPILYSLMHVPLKAEDKWATPRPGEDPELLWEEFWDALDFIRLQLERPVRSSFNASFEKLLQYPWEVVFHGPSGTSSALQALVRHGHSASSAGQYLWSAISQDPLGAELARTLEAVDRARADGRLRVIIIDLPRQANVSLIIGELQARGLECTSTTYRTSLGVPAARRRQRAWLCRASEPSTRAFREVSGSRPSGLETAPPRSRTC